MGLHAQTEVQTDSAAEVRDSVVVSLITCTPGQQAYEFYGHTAIRVREVRAGRQSDWVFNYGTFSFKEENFIWRFVLGEAHFELSVLPYAYFYQAYVNDGRGIQEQRLNLNPAEEKRLVEALSKNLLPENAAYLYNFFYDNCSTRAIEQIEAAVDGKIIWNEKGGEQETLRDIVHRFSAGSPWYTFGQDLLLGAEADRVADRKLKMFAPIYARDLVADAMVEGPDGTRKHLAAPFITLLPAAPMPDKAFPVSPMWAFGILLAFTVALCIYEWRKGKYFWQYDALLLLAQGAVGCIIAFLFFFSSHPAVDSNYLLALFNPLPLFYFPWLMKYASMGQQAKGMYVQALMILAALGFGLCGLQVYPPEVYLIMVILALRLLVHLKKTQK